MRLSNFFICFALGIFLSGCAYQGTIVEKTAEPSPFYHSAGIDGSYSFLLRDNTGTVRRQTVTPDVYALYNVGEYFNDLQPRQEGAFDGKTMLTARVPRSAPIGTSLAKVRKPGQLSVAMMSKSRKPRPAATARRATASRKVAAKPLRKKSTKTVQRTARTKAKTAPAPAAKAQPILRPLPVDTRVGLAFRVARCR